MSGVDGTSVLRLGIPKGSLEETTLRLFSEAGYQIDVSSRSYYPEIDDPEIECILVRAQELAHYVEQGAMDVGVTGLDWIRENRARVDELADLRAPWKNYRPVRWVLAVKEDSPFEKPADLVGGRIATEAVRLTENYLRERDIEAEVEFSWGATEVKPPLLADAIVDISETGSSLRANDLRVIDEILESTPRLIANREAASDPWKRRKMDHLALLLRGALAAIGRVGLMMNVPRNQLQRVLGVLPALATPTISTLSNDAWVAINTVLEERAARTLIPQLVECGARGLVEYPLSKVLD